MAEAVSSWCVPVGVIRVEGVCGQGVKLVKSAVIVAGQFCGVSAVVKLEVVVDQGSDTWWVWSRL